MEAKPRNLRLLSGTKGEENRIHRISEVLILAMTKRLLMVILLSYCGLIDAKIRASDKDFPVQKFKISPGINSSLQIVMVF